MFRTIRTLISLVVLVALVWWTFTYRIGGSTVAEHLERIGDTPEAKGLVNGAKTRLDPVLDEAKQRMIGEYVEAPTKRSPRLHATRGQGPNVATHADRQGRPSNSDDQRRERETPLPEHKPQPDQPIQPTPASQRSEHETEPARAETMVDDSTEANPKAAAQPAQPSTPKTARLPGRAGQ